MFGPESLEGNNVEPLHLEDDEELAVEVENAETAKVESDSEGDPKELNPDEDLQFPMAA